MSVLLRFALAWLFAHKFPAARDVLEFALSTFFAASKFIYVH